MRRILACAALFVAACSDATVIEVQRLAPGGGVAGLGGADAAARPRPSLDIVIRLEADSTEFNPADLMRLLVNGTDMAEDVALGGLYGVLSIDAAGILDAPQTVDLFKRMGPVKDSYTFTVTTYAGPTLTDAAPAQGTAGTVVRLTGTGFLAAAARVFFGGVEAAVVTVVDDTAIDATVPQGAVPGLVWVLIGEEAAEGLVGFQPLDGAGGNVPFPEVPTLFAVFPASGVTETPVRVYGVVFDQFTFPSFNGTFSTAVLGVETVTLPIGDIVSAWAVVLPETDPGAGTVLLDLFGLESNELPFTVR